MPRPSIRALTLLVAAPFVAVACTTTASGGPTEAPSTAAAATQPAAETVTATDPTADPQPPRAAWLDIELTDAASGETFTLASLAGEVVAIEPMAIWCSSCKVQQDNVKAAYADLEPTGVRYISLGVDPNERPEALAQYAERRGYGWTFAQSPVELSRALRDEFGAQILAPPSTPLIVLDPAGEVVFQDFGFHGPERLVEIIAEASA
jgi:cytochrome oxidase Cu insertion factor (SCO1/SenC/PrrC family)